MKRKSQSLALVIFWFAENYVVPRKNIKYYFFREGIRNLRHQEIVQNIFEVVRNIFEIIQNIFEVVQNIFEIIQNIFEIIQNIFEIIQNIFEEEFFFGEGKMRLRQKTEPIIWSCQKKCVNLHSNI